MITLEPSHVKTSIKMTRREKSRRKILKRRRLLFLAITFIFILLSLFIFNISKKQTALSSPDTALEYYMLNSFNHKLNRIDNSELIYSHDNKSIYKVYGIDNAESFKIYEVALKKNSSRWSIDNLKNLN